MAKEQFPRLGDWAPRTGDLSQEECAARHTWSYEVGEEGQVPGVIRLTVAFLAVSTFACQSLPHQSGPVYTVTATPINLLGPNRTGHCFAIDLDARALWIWEPGWNPPGCGSRSTGPGVTRLPDATVTKGAAGEVEIKFQLELQITGMRDFRLVLQNGFLRDTASGQQVATGRRSDLNLPGPAIKTVPRPWQRPHTLRRRRQ